MTEQKAMSEGRLDTSPDRLAEALANSTATAQRIIVKDFRSEMTIGVTAEERAQPQQIAFNVELSLRVAPPVRDEVAETLNYGLVVRLLRQFARESEYSLLETLAEALAGAFFTFDEVCATRIQILKLERYSDVDGIGIEIERARKSTS